MRSRAADSCGPRRQLTPLRLLPLPLQTTTTHYAFLADALLGLQMSGSGNSGSDVPAATAAAAAAAVPPASVPSGDSIRSLNLISLALVFQFLQAPDLMSSNRACRQWREAAVSPLVMRPHIRIRMDDMLGAVVCGPQITFTEWTSMQHAAQSKLFRNMRILRSSPGRADFAERHHVERFALLQQWNSIHTLSLDWSLSRNAAMPRRKRNGKLQEKDDLTEEEIATIERVFQSPALKHLKVLRIQARPQLIQLMLLIVQHELKALEVIELRYCGSDAGHRPLVTPPTESTPATLTRTRTPQNSRLFQTLFTALDRLDAQPSSDNLFQAPERYFATELSRIASLKFAYIAAPVQPVRPDGGVAPQPQQTVESDLDELVALPAASPALEVCWRIAVPQFLPTMWMAQRRAKGLECAIPRCRSIFVAEWNPAGADLADLANCFVDVSSLSIGSCLMTFRFGDARPIGAVPFPASLALRLHSLAVHCPTSSHVVAICCAAFVAGSAFPLLTRLHLSAPAYPFQDEGPGDMRESEAKLLSALTRFPALTDFGVQGLQLGVSQAQAVLAAVGPKLHTLRGVNWSVLRDLSADASHFRSLLPNLRVLVLQRLPLLLECRALFALEHLERIEQSQSAAPPITRHRIMTHRTQRQR